MQRPSFIAIKAKKYKIKCWNGGTGVKLFAFHTSKPDSSPRSIHASQYDPLNTSDL